MENVHAERSAGWAVFCYVAIVIIAIVITGPLPPPTLHAADIGLVLGLHKPTLLLSAWLAFPAAAFFLWFIVGLRTYLAHAPGRQEGLSMFALCAGIVMVALSLVAACIQAAVVYTPADVFRGNGMAGLYGAFVFLQNGVAFAPVGIFSFAVAHSMRRHESAPEWLAWFGYIAAVGNGIASLSIFVPDGFMSPTGAGPQVFGAFPTGVWLIAVGVELVRRRPDAANRAVVPRS